MATDREDGWLCRQINDGEESFPCNAAPIDLVSLAIAAGGVGLIMTVWLTHQVCKRQKTKLNRRDDKCAKQKHIPCTCLLSVPVDGSLVFRKS